MYLIIEEVVRGDRGDATNPFQWSHIRLNLPGSVTYDPSKAWITKRRTDESLASEVVDFVDDERVVGSGEDRVLAAGHALSSRESYLGLQDALRKLRPATRQPGGGMGRGCGPQHSFCWHCCAYVTGEVGQDLENLASLVREGEGRRARAPIQASTVRPWFPGLCLQCLPRFEAILKGNPPNARNVAGWT